MLASLFIPSSFVSTALAPPVSVDSGGVAGLDFSGLTTTSPHDKALPFSGRHDEGTCTVVPADSPHADRWSGKAMDPSREGAARVLLSCPVRGVVEETNEDDTT